MRSEQDQRVRLDLPHMTHERPEHGCRARPPGEGLIAGARSSGPGRGKSGDAVGAALPHSKVPGNLRAAVRNFFHVKRW